MSRNFRIFKYLLELSINYQLKCVDRDLDVNFLFFNVMILDVSVEFVSKDNPKYDRFGSCVFISLCFNLFIISFYFGERACLCSGLGSLDFIGLMKGKLNRYSSWASYYFLFL